MKNLISDCILLNNFVRFGHKILIRNETSHTILAKPESITVKELKESGLALEIPINVCQKGHNLTLFFVHFEATTFSKVPVSGRYKDAQFEALVKVDSLEKTTADSVFIEVNFTQYDIDIWKKLLNQYVKKQDSINTMILHQHQIRDEE